MKNYMFKKLTVVGIIPYLTEEEENVLVERNQVNQQNRDLTY